MVVPNDIGDRSLLGWPEEPSADPGDEGEAEDEDEAERLT